MTECPHCQSELIHPLTEYIDATDDTKKITVYRCFFCGANFVVESTNPKYLIKPKKGYEPRLCFAHDQYGCWFKSGIPEPAEKVIPEYEEA